MPTYIRASTTGTRATNSARYPLATGAGLLALAAVACFNPTYEDGIRCSRNQTCPEGLICDPVDNRCRATALDPTCSDDLQNGDESDVDCGGSCDPCDIGDGCNQGSDCVTQACAGDVCAAPSCGDGAVNDTGEDCDDGGESASCDADCTAAECGDGTTNNAAGESCDDTGESATCDIDCTDPMCGDGIVNMSYGEVCDDMGESALCDADCTISECGDGTSNTAAGEDCDDAGESATCDADCTAVVCGDGVVNDTAGEQCDDGNMADGDGCSSACLNESYGLVFLTSSNGTAGWYQYDIALDTWSTPAQPPVTTHTQLTNDGQYAYLMGDDNMVYAYDPGADSWAASIPGPTPSVSSPIGIFHWFVDGFYYCNDGTTTMYVYRAGSWTNFPLGSQCSSAGTWDQANDELYVRTMFELGFQVIDTTNDSIARTIVDTTNVGENSRTGSYYQGYFYARTSSGPFQQLDALTGAKVDTGSTPISQHTGTDTDFNAGLIYISGYGSDPTSFQVFDPIANTITTLADQPSLGNHSTITVMR